MTLIGFHYFYRQCGLEIYTQPAQNSMRGPATAPQICYYIHMKLILYNIYKRSSRNNKKTSFNPTVCYRDDVPSSNNPNFNDYMLFIQRYLRLKTLQMLQNGLIISTIIWSLMRMVDITHDFMTSMMTLISL